MLGKWLGPQEAVALLGFAEGDQILLDQVRWERSSAGSHFPFWLGEALDYPPPQGAPRVLVLSTGSSDCAGSPGKSAWLSCFGV